MTSTLELNAKVDSRPSGVQPLFRNKEDHEFYEYILNDIPDMDLNLFKEINDYGIENWVMIPSSLKMEKELISLIVISDSLTLLFHTHSMCG